METTSSESIHKNHVTLEIYVFWWSGLDTFFTIAIFIEVKYMVKRKKDKLFMNDIFIPEIILVAHNATLFTGKFMPP